MYQLHHKAKIGSQASKAYLSSSKFKARENSLNIEKKKIAIIVMAFFIIALMILNQLAHASTKQTLSKISYSEMEAINKGMGLIQISARVQDRNTQFNAGVKAYTDQDFSLALRLFEPLAIHGHSASQYYLGVLYDMGTEYTRNSRVAYQWYRLAAIGGDDRAQHNLAVAYAKGDGVEVSLAKAMKWWTISSLQGNADSQYNLGILYAMGQGRVSKDIVKAMKWWRKAATSGDAVAQFNLGTIYANGDGGVQNYCEAERWWVQSAESGFSEAHYALNVLRKRNDYYSCD